MASNIMSTKAYASKFLTRTQISEFLHMDRSKRRCPLLMGSFSLRPLAIKERNSVWIDSEDLAANDANADKTASLTSSFPNEKKIEHNTQSQQTRQKRRG